MPCLLRGIFFKNFTPMSSVQKNLRKLLGNSAEMPGRFNPARPVDPAKSLRDEPSLYTVFDYDQTNIEERKTLAEQDCQPYRDSGRITWINIDGLHKEEVERLCAHYKIHYLVVEDILNVGQRAKMDELGECIYLLLPMLVYNKDTGMVDEEQLSILQGKDFVISFQEDARRDAFNSVRDRLRKGNQKLRSSDSEYLSYSLVDAIVDNYFEVIEQLHARARRLEDKMMEAKRSQPLNDISLLRREVMKLVTAIMPVRELINEIVSSESPMLSEANDKYWRDVRDHIFQASDYADSLRDAVRNLQDLHMTQMNTRMNEVMKVFTMVTTLLAPATVIGGIYGMNFHDIPLAENPEGFWIMVGIMLTIPLLMLIWFRRKGWF